MRLDRRGGARVMIAGALAVTLGLGPVATAAAAPPWDVHSAVYAADRGQLPSQEAAPAPGGTDDSVAGSALPADEARDLVEISRQSLLSTS